MRLRLKRLFPKINISFVKKLFLNIPQRFRFKILFSLGLLSFLLFALTVTVDLSQRPQNIRGKAATTPSPTPTPGPACITNENFNAMPAWNSSNDASWGGSADWTAPSYLLSTRSNTGSSTRVKVYPVSPNTNYVISIDMKGTQALHYWTEAGYKLGNFSAEDFNNNYSTWTLVNKFCESFSGCQNGNGGIWTTYTSIVNSGNNSSLSLGFKAGLGIYGTVYPGGYFDNLSICVTGATPTPTPTPTPGPTPTPTPTPLPTTIPTPTPTPQPGRRPFTNKVGWAYSALPGVSRGTMVADLTRMKNAGANIVYIGHGNPANADPNSTEPGLTYAIYFSIRNNTSSRSNAETIYNTIIDSLEAAKQVGLDVVLPIGYQIQMGDEWNGQNNNELRRNPDGSLMNHWGSGNTASPYSAKYKQDINEYYWWVNQNFITRYSNILAVNLGDEPMGSDFSSHAKAAFQGRYGTNFDTASAYQKGEFLSGVIADWAAWGAGTWKGINPTIWTMMTFHIQRDVPWFPDVEEIFYKTPDNFIFSADTHLHDDLPNKPITDREITLLYGITRTVSWLSKVYNNPIMLWTSTNAWGLAWQSGNPGGIDQARQNLQIVATVGREDGGSLGMIMSWAYNIRGQGLFGYNGNYPVDPNQMFNTISADLASLKGGLSTSPQNSPRNVILLDKTRLYEYVGANNISHLTGQIVDLWVGYGNLLRQENTVVLRSGRAKDQAVSLGARVYGAY